MEKRRYKVSKQEAVPSLELTRVPQGEHGENRGDIIKETVRKNLPELKNTNLQTKSAHRIHSLVDLWRPISRHTALKFQMKRNKEEILEDTTGGGGRGWRGSTYNVRHSKLLGSKLCSNTLDILRDVSILYFPIHSNYRSDIKVKEDFRYARTQALYFPYALSLDLLEDVLQWNNGIKQNTGRLGIQETEEAL